MWTKGKGNVYTTEIDNCIHAENHSWQTKSQGKNKVQWDGILKNLLEKKLMKMKLGQVKWLSK